MCWVNKNREIKARMNGDEMFTPIACGDTRWQKRDANTMRMMGYEIQARYCKATFPFSSPNIHLYAKRQTAWLSYNVDGVFIVFHNDNSHNSSSLLILFKYVKIYNIITTMMQNLLYISQYPMSTTTISIQDQERFFQKMALCLRKTLKTTFDLLFYIYHVWFSVPVTLELG